MAWELLLLIIVVAAGLLHLYFRTFVKSTVEESVKHQFALERQARSEQFQRDMKAQDRKDKYQLVALDKRLEVHQKAFALSLEMLRTVHSQMEIRNEMEGRLYAFWDNNCLYLSNDARKQFKLGMNYYSTYEMMVKSFRANPSDKREAKLEEMFKHLNDVPEFLAKAVDLEAMSAEPLTVDGKKVTPLGLEDKKD